MRWHDILQTAKHGLDTTGKFLVPVLQHVTHDGPLQIRLRATQVARNDGKFALFGVFHDVLFAHVGERANDDMIAIVRNEFRWHRLQLAAVKHVQEKRAENVLAMMAERDFRAAQLFRGAIQNADAVSFRVAAACADAIL